MIKAWPLKAFEFLGLLVIALSFASCVPQGKTDAAIPASHVEKKMNTPVYIVVGESPSEFTKRYGGLIEENKKNFGVEFYSINWSSKNRNAVDVRNGDGEFRIESAVTVMGTYDGEHQSEGIAQYYIQFGLVPYGDIPHDAAMQKLYGIMQQIQKAGWKRWIDPSLPRISSQEALRYHFSKLDITADLISPDPNYLPSLDEWMKLEEMTSWQFYKDKVIMTIKLMRDQSKMTTNLPGDYFITMNLDAESTYQRASVPEEERQHWQAAYPSVRKHNLLDREKSEAKLAPLGFKIDTAYQNPDELPH